MTFELGNVRFLRFRKALLQLNQTPDVLDLLLLRFLLLGHGVDLIFALACFVASLRDFLELDFQEGDVGLLVLGGEDLVGLGLGGIAPHAVGDGRGTRRGGLALVD